MPDDAPILDQKRLGRLMPHAEPFRDGVRQTPILDDVYGSTNQFARTLREIRKLLVGLRAD
jgi:hypothetical protein